MHDAPTNTDADDQYECLECGEIIEADSHPVECPECECGMQKRANSLE